jgi:hypothetical protein
MFLADLNWTYFPYGFFQFDSSKITLRSLNHNTTQSANITEIPVTKMQLIGAKTDSPSIVVNKGNSDFNYSETITISKGARFANMTIVIESNNQNVSLEWVDFIVESQGIFQEPFNNTVAMLDPPMKECGQLIFAKTQPTVTNFTSQNPCVTQLSYNLQGQSKAEIQILVGLYIVSENDIQSPTSPSGLKGTLTGNLQNPQTGPDLPITTFDYKTALQQYSVSYIANRDLELNHKYTDDSEFSLVFINNEVAIFKVKANANPAG